MKTFKYLLFTVVVTIAGFFASSCNSDDKETDSFMVRYTATTDANNSSYTIKYIDPNGVVTLNNVAGGTKITREAGPFYRGMTVGINATHNNSGGDVITPGDPSASTGNTVLTIEVSENGGVYAMRAKGPSPLTYKIPE